MTRQITRQAAAVVAAWLASAGSTTTGGGVLGELTVLENLADRAHSPYAGIGYRRRGARVELHLHPLKDTERWP